ncbi:MAG: aminotransferase class III [Bacteroidetes bacterium GWE2_41_25]|nr:MAG: aminotransferase class III [Bacteroidetes bacterium GWA2_40_15]OFY00439.1 MAG: aminotransferase class III [Bacteroidetes bacterium GWE2_41_25]HBH83105.1 aspartate aminotransferase family protein [Bacteroidales bacterium]HBQ84277.1 aspartate aminotransferase family protein [Bacteroidales bacterium]HCU20352.1 aspartate aminotransferase family protein [Bacteroidales bacterium]
MFTNRQLFLSHIGQTSPQPMLLEIVRAEGVWLYDADGKKYIDLISGVSVSNTGHRHLKIVNAVKEQMDKYMHLMVYGEMIQSPQVKYAEKIAGLLPKGLETCFFVNSGSEAVEGAMKLAKRYTGRSRIIYFRNAFHGSTHGALSIQGSELYRNAFRPLLPDTVQIGFNDAEALNNIDSKTACVIIEPVQAEAGIIYPEDGFLGKVRSRCNETGALLIFDEIQTGFGRTGYLFAFERFGVIPDILLLAKALGGGMPLGAFISSSGIMSSLASDPVLGHITTFGGHPVCCAAGLASLNVILDENLVANCSRRSDSFKDKLSHPAISEVRGEGLLLAVELTNPEYVRVAVSKAPDYGLILDYFLFCNNAFRIAPPLTINEEETVIACRQINNLLDDIVKGKC